VAITGLSLSDIISPHYRTLEAYTESRDRSRIGNTALRNAVTGANTAKNRNDAYSTILTNNKLECDNVASDMELERDKGVYWIKFVGESLEENPNQARIRFINSEPVSFGRRDEHNQKNIQRELYRRFDLGEKGWDEKAVIKESKKELVRIQIAKRITFNHEAWPSNQLHLLYAVLKELFESFNSKQHGDIVVSALPWDSSVEDHERERARIITAPLFNGRSTQSSLASSQASTTSGENTDSGGDTATEGPSTKRAYRDWGMPRPAPVPVFHLHGGPGSGGAASGENPLGGSGTGGSASASVRHYTGGTHFHSYYGDKPTETTPNSAYGYPSTTLYASGPSYPSSSYPQPASESYAQPAASTSASNYYDDGYDDNYQNDASGSAPNQASGYPETYSASYTEPVAATSASNYMDQIETGMEQATIEDDNRSAAPSSSRHSGKNHHSNRNRRSHRAVKTQVFSGEHGLYFDDNGKSKYLDELTPEKRASLGRLYFATNRGTDSGADEIQYVDELTDKQRASLEMNQDTTPRFSDGDAREIDLAQYGLAYSATPSMSQSSSHSQASKTPDNSEWKGKSRQAADSALNEKISDRVENQLSKFDFYYGYYGYYDNARRYEKYAELCEELNAEECELFQKKVKKKYGDW
jgi:hypothetical protein